ncbi:putative Gamma-tubulin complex component 2 [Blattamonas nauphoetae]|uniref:Gamma-tubulin complex component 2 n=1 Tax=Blattamonas nauphoetae TaxID=2049346 RepID=A0ABQ9Y4Z4_9EUKA|nr:putative Gamma-tubulin complex component 2 [Blattamonas nauphoetae]
MDRGPPSLQALPYSMQEDEIIEDFLNILMGISTNTIAIADLKPPRLEINTSLDPSLQAISQRVLPLARAYIKLSLFVSNTLPYAPFHPNLTPKSYLQEDSMIDHRNMDGRIKLCLCDSLHTVLWEYHCMVTSLETLFSRGDLKLLEFVGYIQPNACVPFFEMLQNWLYHGRLDDPYDEFFITPDKTHKDGFFIPGEKGDVSLIAETGKYIQTIRSMGKEIPGLIEEKFVYTSPQNTYSHMIRKAHEASSQGIGEIILRDQLLGKRLWSLKKVLMFAESDFFVNFMDVVEGEMRKDSTIVSLHQVNTLLNVSLNSCFPGDEYNQDFSCSLCSTDLIQEMKIILGESSRSRERSKQSQDRPHLAWHVLSITQTIPYPSDMVLNSLIMQKINLIFRHLFSLKYTDRRLNASRLVIQSISRMRERPSRRASGLTLLAGTGHVRRTAGQPDDQQLQAILDDTVRITSIVWGNLRHTVQGLLDYSCRTVIERVWKTLMHQLSSATTFQQIYQTIETGVSDILHDILLSLTSILEIINAFLQLADEFCEMMEFVRVNREHLFTAEFRARLIAMHGNVIQTRHALVLSLLEQSKQNGIIKDLIVNLDFQEKIMGEQGIHRM